MKRHVSHVLTRLSTGSYHQAMPWSCYTLSKLFRTFSVVKSKTEKEAPSCAARGRRPGALSVLLYYIYGEREVGGRCSPLLTLLDSSL